MHKVSRIIRPEIAVVGCGGTGSHVINNLVDVHLALLNLKCQGLEVVAYDGDFVAPENIGRQSFYLQDVGMQKSRVLIERINMHYGTDWEWKDHLTVDNGYQGHHSPDILISCVDTKASRRIIAEVLSLDVGWNLDDDAYIIECGNARASGQVILGQHHGDLPNPYDEYPQLTEGREPKGEGCLDPYYKQDLPVNRQVAVYVQQLIWNLLRKHEISHRGAFFDLSVFSCNGVQTTRKEGA